MLARAFELALVQGDVHATYRTVLEGRIEHELVLQKICTTRKMPEHARAWSCCGKAHRLCQHHALMQAQTHGGGQFLVVHCANHWMAIWRRPY